jgi:hypothetical protein
LTHDRQARILGQATKNWFDRFHKMIGGEFLSIDGTFGVAQTQERFGECLMKAVVS